MRETDAKILLKGERPNRRNGHFIPCKNCGKEIYVRPCEEKTKGYCSRKCVATSDALMKVLKSPERRLLISRALKGRKIKGHPQTPETRKKIGDFNRGKHLSEEHKRKISDTERGKSVSQETRDKISKNNARIWTGKHLPEEIKLKISEAQRGEKHYNWKGGISSENMVIRNSRESRLWRDAVFQRDNFTCVWCGIRGHKGLGKRVVLHADHIQTFAEHPELRFAIDNGRTLCIDCHHKRHKNK